ncbi:2-nitropropane dioxygenase [Penicillium digitatum PHI26]|uniref:2-nitropropane dioxygenase n=2 Tax=Penicillium digitatum TaxID=36651 RepID=K9FWV0_PEND2|nr:2-nitropropane dioxygenase [Penicillium digitatum Pd1]EKV13012.1 2-nitropropane dioxygenase [Penicillium digitatum PHI26]EKV18705.1 2-nitropropane dioxygenase [Penicillium digitatum Pd1]
MWVPSLRSINWWQSGCLSFGRTLIIPPLMQAVRGTQYSSDWGTKITVHVGTIKSTVEALPQRMDVLVVQGTDAGRHQWAQGTSLISLLPEVRDLLSKFQNTTTAILAAGGIVDGRGCVAALGLGGLFRSPFIADDWQI